MSFLDNLENNLKSLESREEKQDGREQRQREAERARALAAAPWAETLKTSPFAQELMRQATRLGFTRRMKVRMAWIGATLRLEAGEQRLELAPTAEGVEAAFFQGQERVENTPVDLDGDAAALAARWLS